MEGDKEVIVIRMNHGVEMKCGYGREDSTAKDDAEVSRSQSELS